IKGSGETEVEEPVGFPHAAFDGGLSVGNDGSYSLLDNINFHGIGIVTGSIEEVVGFEGGSVALICRDHRADLIPVLWVDNGGLCDGLGLCSERGSEQRQQH